MPNDEPKRMQCKITPESAKKMISNIDRWLKESKEAKPNDEPKISPSVMKAVEAVYKLTVSTTIQAQDYIYEDCPTVISFDFYGKNIDQICASLSRVIDAATHLTDKEAALRELMEAVKANRETFIEGSTVLDRVIQMKKDEKRVSAALAKAEKVMEL